MISWGTDVDTKSTMKDTQAAVHNRVPNKLPLYPVTRAIIFIYADKDANVVQIAPNYR